MQTPFPLIDLMIQCQYLLKFSGRSENFIEPKLLPNCEVTTENKENNNTPQEPYILSESQQMEFNLKKGPLNLYAI